MKTQKPELERLLEFYEHEGLKVVFEVTSWNDNEEPEPYTTLFMKGSRWFLGRVVGQMERRGLRCKLYQVEGKATVKAIMQCEDLKEVPVKIALAWAALADSKAYDSIGGLGLLCLKAALEMP